MAFETLVKLCWSVRADVHATAGMIVSEEPAPRPVGSGLLLLHLDHDSAGLQQRTFPGWGGCCVFNMFLGKQVQRGLEMGRLRAGTGLKTCSGNT